MRPIRKQDLATVNRKYHASNVLWPTAGLSWEALESRRSSALYIPARSFCIQPDTMSGMLSLRHLRFLTIAAALVVVCGISLSAQESSHRGRKYKPPPPTSKVNITVVRADDSKPIENAAVIFHIDGDKGNMELKSNEDGKTTLDILPIGSIMSLQIIAKGYQTYGEDFKIDKPEMTFEVRMKRPVRQYSIYEKHDQASDSKKDEKNDDGAKKDPKDSKDKPSDSSDPSSKPDQSSKPQSQ